MDIFYKVEVRNDEGKWEAVQVPNPYRNAGDFTPDVELYAGRDYQLFNILGSSSRDETYPQMDAPRGIPSDASEATREFYEKVHDSAFDASWFTLYELGQWEDNPAHFKPSYWDVLDDDEKLAEEKEGREMKERFGHFVQAVSMTAGMMKWYAKPSDVRIVFWFDS
jgi:hypothetical protein